MSADSAVVVDRDLLAAIGIASSGRFRLPGAGEAVLLVRAVAEGFGRRAAAAAQRHHGLAVDRLAPGILERSDVLDEVRPVGPALDARWLGHGRRVQRSARAIVPGTTTSAYMPKTRSASRMMDASTLGSRGRSACA